MNISTVNVKIKLMDTNQSYKLDIRYIYRWENFSIASYTNIPTKEYNIIEDIGELLSKNNGWKRMRVKNLEVIGLTKFSKVLISYSDNLIFENLYLNKLSPEFLGWFDTNELSISNIKFWMIYIQDIRHISIFDCEFLQIIWNNYQEVKTVSLFSDNIRKHKIHLFWMRIEDIKFSSTFWSTPRYEFALNRCKVLWWDISHVNFDNFNTVKSIITNTIFSYIEFPARKESFSISESIFEKNNYFNVNWWKYFTENHSDTIRYTYSYMKDVFRMFKFEYDSIWNKTEANKFFAKEMEYYRKSLTWRDWDKKIISLLQEYSNNYGNSWIYPLGWTFIISSIYTSLHFFNNTQHSHCWEWFCLHSFLFTEFFSEVIKNINVLDDFKNIQTPWDFLFRIIIAFFIYQFIVALRRISQR